MIDLSDLALRRHEQRSPDGPVRFAGSRVIVEIVQELIDAEGQRYGTGVVSVEGRRAFGGKVLFDPAHQPVVTGTSLPGDRDYLRMMMGHMLEVLKTLCVCGGLPGETLPCLCCPSCSGLGHRPGEKSAEECKTCSGTGLRVPASTPVQLDRF